MSASYSVRFPETAMKSMRALRVAVLTGFGVLLAVGQVDVQAGTPGEETSKALASRQLTLAENVVAARAAYQESLEAMVSYYEATGDAYKLKQAKMELAALAAAPKPQYVTVAEVLIGAKAEKEIPDANRVLEDAEHYHKLGETSDRKKNETLALERCLDLMRRYPESNRIDDAAYLAGRIYEDCERDRQKAMVYYQRCYEWNRKTTTDARIRAANMAYRLRERAKAKLLYEEAAKTVRRREIAARPR
jgi:hypothetical protein